MKKRVLTTALCFLLSLCLVLPVGAAGSGQRTVGEGLRVIDGIAEVVTMFLKGIWLPKEYKNCETVFDIPEIGGKYVPQGYCFIDSRNLFAITYYCADDNSIISFVDSATGERVKTLKLAYEDGSPCLAHVGGAADVGDSVLISSGKSVRRLKIDDALGAEDYSTVKFSGKLATDMQASYTCAYGNLLFVGQYYAFTLDGGYDSPAEHYLYTPAGKRQYAMCEVFDLTDMDSAFVAEKAAPVAALSMPSFVQGIAYDGKTLAVSSSYTTLCRSELKTYSLPDFASEMSIELGGSETPLIFIDDGRLISSTVQPPMLEGIDWCGGKITGIFESGAEKFTSARVRMPYICEFSV